MKIISIDDGRTTRDVRIMVVDYPSRTVPIVSPVVPAPAETDEWRHSKAESKVDSRTTDEETRIRVPPRERIQRSPVYQPWIVLRDIHHVWCCRLNDDRLRLCPEL